MSNPIKVLMGITAQQKMKHWINIARGEVSGLGAVEEIRNDRGIITGFIIDEIYLLKQQSGSADTILDDEAVGQFLFEMAKSGGDTSKIKLWWHSHGDLGVFWSTTDEANIQRLANSSYMISIVGNKDRKSLTRIDLYQPFHVTLQDICTELYYPSEPELEVFCKKEFVAKVIEHQFISPSAPSRFIDDLVPTPFPGRGNHIDAEIARLEELASAGRMSIEEYDDRMAELMLYQQEFEC